MVLKLRLVKYFLCSVPILSIAFFSCFTTDDDCHKISKAEFWNGVVKDTISFSDTLNLNYLAIENITERKLFGNFTICLHENADSISIKFVSKDIIFYQGKNDVITIELGYKLE